MPCQHVPHCLFFFNIVFGSFTCCVCCTEKQVRASCFFTYSPTVPSHPGTLANASTDHCGHLRYALMLS
uniref:Putative secreted protein n=1 Tax=Amblyomma parvum TaxID=251391 RepID=A0A023FYY1_AMBPA